MSKSEFIDPSNKLARIVRPTRWRGFSDCEASVIIGNRGDAKSQVVAFAGLGRLMQTPQADRRLLVRAWATAIAAKIVLRFFGVENLRAWASRQGRGRADFERIVWAARVVARRMPAATCLSSALALQRELSDNGYHSELHIGVARNAEALLAHAWVERDGRILIGEHGRTGYTRLTSWQAGIPEGIRADC